MKKLIGLGVVLIGALVSAFYFLDAQSDKFPGVMVENSDVFDRVIVIPDETAPQVQTYLIFPHGEMHNPYAVGMAHYVEHLAYANMKDDSQQPLPAHSNAWTNPHTTGYWMAGPAENFPATLRRLITVSKPLQVSAEYALSERDIIQREYERRNSENYLAPFFNDMSRILHNDGPLSRSVIGQPDDIAMYRLDDTMALHARSHQLGQATLLVYGNISHAAVQSEMAALDRSKPMAAAPPRAPLDLGPVVPLFERKTENLDHQAQELMVFQQLVATTPCANFVECAAILSLTKNSVDTTEPGGIAGPLRFDNFLARSFDFYMYYAAPDRILVQFLAWPDVDVSVAELDQAFVAVWNDVTLSGIPVDTIESKRQHLLTDIDSILPKDRAGAEFSHVLELLSQNQPIFDLNTWRANLQKVSAQQVNSRLASLHNNGRIVIRNLTHKPQN